MGSSRGKALAVTAAAAAAVALLGVNRASAVVQTYSAASGAGGKGIDHPGHGFFQFDPGQWDTGLDLSPSHPPAGEFAFSGSDGSFHMEVRAVLDQGVTGRTGDHAGFFIMNYNPDPNDIPNHSFGSFWFGGVGNDIGPFPKNAGVPVPFAQVLAYADVITPAGKPMEFRTESAFIAAPGNGREFAFTGTGTWQTVGGPLSGAVPFGSMNLDQPQLSSLIAFGQGGPTTNEITGVDDGLDPANVPTVIVDNFTLTVALATWNVDGSGSWSADSNWSPVAPDGANATAVFGNAITAPRTVTIDGPHFAGTVRFDSAQPYTLDGTGVLAIRGIADAAFGGTFSGNGGINAVTGSHTVSAPLELWSNTTVNVAQPAAVLTLSNLQPAPFAITLTKTGPGRLDVNNVRAQSLVVSGGTLKILPGGTANSVAGTSKVTSLSISPGSVLDLTNNSAIIDYTTLGTTLSDVRGHLRAGRLTTSAVTPANTRLGYGDNATLGRSTFAGLSVDSTSVLIKFTFAGDADLDGDADGVDIGTWATNFSGELSSGPSASLVWTQGDWDYDGDVDGVDAGLWATAFTGELSGGGLGAVVVETTNPQAASVLQGLGVTVVPEPATLGVFGLCLAGVASRRRFRRGAAAAEQC